MTTPKRPKAELVPPPGGDVGSVPPAPAPQPAFAAPSDPTDDDDVVQALFDDIPVREIARMQVFSMAQEATPSSDPAAPGSPKMNIKFSYFARQESLHDIDETRIAEDCGPGSYFVCAKDSKGRALGWKPVGVDPSYTTNTMQPRGDGSRALQPAHPVQYQAPIMETPGGFVGVPGLDPMAQAMMVMHSSHAAAIREDMKFQIMQIVEMHKATMARPVESGGSEIALLELRRMVNRNVEEMAQLRGENDRERRANTQLAVQNAHVTAGKAVAPNTVVQVLEAALANAPSLLAALTAALGAQPATGLDGQPLKRDSSVSGVYPTVQPPPVTNGHNGHNGAAG